MSGTPTVLKLCRCFCHDLKMCMNLLYNPQINFVHFFQNVSSVPCVSDYSYSLIHIFLKLYMCLCPECVSVGKIFATMLLPASSALI